MGTQVNPAIPCCVLLGAGDILDTAVVREMIPPGSFVICADGGISHCESLGLTPDLLVGDLDSACSVPHSLPKIVCDAVDKDYTDTALAINEAAKRGYTRVLMTGMLGGRRLDHTIANLQILAWCATSGIEAVVTDGITDAYALSAGRKPRQLVVQPKAHSYFSLLSLVERCGAVTIEGGKYPLRGYPLSSLEFPRAVSNEFDGGPVTITLEEGALVVLVTPMD